jgi:multicomponent Na+:H+ antiporter subunit G
LRQYRPARSSFWPALSGCFPDTLTRLHALTKADNLGLGLVVLGLLPQAASPRDGLKLISIWLLGLLAGATVSQLIARTARQSEPAK